MEQAITAQPRRSAHRRLRTVQQFCQEHPAFTVGGMRWLLFNRKNNGLEHAVINVGRRVLIDVDRFFTWIDEQNQHRILGKRGSQNYERSCG